MVTFVNQLGEHLERLSLLYQKGAAYALDTYERMYQCDAALAVWLLGQLEEGRVVTE